MIILKINFKNKKYYFKIKNILKNNYYYNPKYHHILIKKKRK
jgi:hypothetical protein